MTENALLDRSGGAAAVIYARVSSKEQAEKNGEAEGYSIPAQRTPASARRRVSGQ